MSIIKKTLFDEKLETINVLINDEDATSKYFKLTELPDTFTGGKNAFLIAGSPELVADTLIKIEIKDAAGNIIYYEPGEGMISSSVNGEPFVTEYYEGVSKVVSVYVYPETAYGPCTITILGELSEYDNNGVSEPVPLNWEGKYNVKWQKQINVNPSLANTTKIRFYKRPVAAITEILSPIYRIESGSKVDSGTNQSFANIKLSNLETFAGDVKRIKVFRTSLGDISDYDMIQDILVESKELLTSYGLSGSVVGNTGILTSETLENYWNTGSLNAFLTSSRVESGVRLTGSGNFTYSSSLDIKSTNTYELNLDAFYSSSSSSNLGIYLASGSISSSIGTLYGISPTKNLLDTVIPFKISTDYPSASLYFSQSQGEWHVGNISLKLSQDTAFSPDEISFVTTMPTVIGNETYNFKFEFYDVNNNYVPVAVTQSLNFTGGTNAVLLISASAASASAQLAAVSSSISGTMTTYSSSASSSVSILSSSVSGSITTVSGSVFTLSGSVSTSVQLLTGSISSSLSSSLGFTSSSIYTLSGSVSASTSALSSSISRSVYNSLTQSFTYVQSLADGNYSGSYISGNIIYAPVIGGQLGYFSTLFKVGQAPNSIYLDARQTPRKIFIGGVIPPGETEYSGAYNNTNTNVYLDSSGKFSLADKLSYDGTNLSVNGTINVTGGNAATDANALLYSQRAAASASISASAAQSNAATDATTKANSAQQTSITVSAISASNAALSASAAFTNAKAVADSIANGTYSGGTLISSTSITSPVIAGANGYISNVFKVGNAGITLDGTNKAIYIGSGVYNNANTGFYVDSNSNFSLADKLSWNGTTLSINGNGTFSGNLSAAGGTFNGSVSIGSGNSIFKADSNGISLGHATFASAPFSVTPAGTLTATSGSIAGWQIASSGLSKTTGSYVLNLDSTNQKISIAKSAETVNEIYDVVVLSAEEDVEPITPNQSVGALDWDTNNAVVQTYNYQNVTEIDDTGFERPDGHNQPTGSGGFGVIGLVYASEEIYVDPDILFAEAPVDNVIQVSTVGTYYANWKLILRVRRFPTEADADAETNADVAFGDRQVVAAERIKAGDPTTYIDEKNAYGAVVQATGGGGIVTAGTPIIYRVELKQIWSVSITGGDSNDSVTFQRPGNQNVRVQYTRVNNGYSILSPGGLRVYQGLKNYASFTTPSGSTGDASNFMLVKGKSQINGSLTVTSGFSAANKQFKIQHPIDDNKWLYHTSIESPRADLIYRGVIGLTNGSGSVSIDSASTMMNGTYVALTKNQQLFLQNESGFDRVIGTVIDGVVSITSENPVSTDTINWMVIAERNDIQILQSPLYNSDGNYKPERYKREYIDQLYNSI